MESEFEHKTFPVTSRKSGDLNQVRVDVHAFVNRIVNVIFVGSAESWVLVDAGMPNSADDILEKASELYGDNARPAAIVLTHGHFDHVGSIVGLVERWKVPVYAHSQEMPYLTGRSDYPPPDPSVEGGLVTELSRLFPFQAIDLGGHVRALPDNGDVPSMPGWRWIHTPGHTPGHVSLFREADRTLIAGDAFVNVEQESVYKVFMQTPEIHGPPRYFTPDWDAAWESVRRLNALKPEAAVTGHGMPMSGRELTQGLERLARDFGEIAIPDYGRYVGQPR